MDSPTTTWQEVNSRLDIFLNDDSFKVVSGEEPIATYPDRQRLLAWHDAQRLLAWHTPRQRTALLTIDRDNRSAILPPDFIGVYRIYDASKQIWMVHNHKKKEGGIRYDDDDLAAYWVWGRTLYLDMEIAADSTEYTMYYWAYWPEVVYDVDDEGEVSVQSDSILVPPWALLPLCHMTSAVCLAPGAMQSAEIRTWNIKVDSGNPIQNPRATAAREHLFWWTSLLGSAPRPSGWVGQ